MCDTEGCPEETRTFIHGGGHQLAHHRRRFICLAQAGIPVVDRERHEGPALMADVAEIAIRDQAERLFSAMVGMHAPADIRE